MTAAVAAFTLLVLAASLASWYCGQRIAQRRPIPGARIALTMAGYVVLIGAAALVAVTLPMTSRSFLHAKLEIIGTVPSAIGGAQAQAVRDPRDGATLPDIPVTPHKLSEDIHLHLKAAQAAMRARDWATALARAAEADAIDGRTEYEDYVIARFLTYIHTQMRNYEEGAAAASRQLRWPELDVAERSRLLLTAMQLRFQIRDYATALVLGAEYLDLAPDDFNARTLVAQALYLMNRFAESSRHIDVLVAASHEQQRPVPPHLLDLQYHAARLSGEVRHANQLLQDMQQNDPERAAPFSPDSARRERQIVVSPLGTPPVGMTYVSSAGGTPLIEEWPATDCVQSKRSAESDRWVLDNGCGAVVAVVVAWCRRAESPCHAHATHSSGWLYEPDGIVMILGERAPPAAPSRGPRIVSTYMLQEFGDLRIRYLACHVTERRALQRLSEPHDAGAPARSAAFRAELESDECYRRVAQWSGVGHRTGKSPDALLREGIDEAAM